MWHVTLGGSFLLLVWDLPAWTEYMLSHVRGLWESQGSLRVKTLPILLFSKLVMLPQHGFKMSLQHWVSHLPTTSTVRKMSVQKRSCSSVALSPSAWRKSFLEAINGLLHNHIGQLWSHTHPRQVCSKGCFTIVLICFLVTGHSTWHHNLQESFNLAPFGSIQSIVKKLSGRNILAVGHVNQSCLVRGDQEPEQGNSTREERTGDHV